MMPIWVIDRPVMDDKWTINQEERSTVDGTVDKFEQNVRNYPLLFEILRSFTTLASTLNLSHAVKELGSTRQTVRRHITQLEELKGGALFRISDRQYQLTELGSLVLPEAQDLLSRAEGWINGKSRQVNGLQYLSHIGDDGWSFFQQQQPVARVFASSGDMLQRTLAAWVASGGEIEHPAMQDVRPYLMVFRRVNDAWLCVELGEESSYVSWFGWADARSSIGRDLGRLPGGEGFGRLVNLAFSEVETNQAIRLDHAFTQIKRTPDGPFVPISFERLLLASKFPDGSFSLLSTVRRTYDVEIKGVSDDMLRLMPEDLLM